MDNKILKPELRNNDDLIPEGFYIREEHKQNFKFGKKETTIYDKAMKLEIEDAYGYNALKPEDQLRQIKKEILIRVRITAHEIFKIGGLLYLAKTACHQAKTSFKEWIRKSFDFSYETANNFMNVYRQCLGMRGIAVQLPISILYKISSPSFPEELRDFLFTEGNINDMTNLDLENLVERYRKDGFSAIKEDVKTYSNQYL